MKATLIAAGAAMLLAGCASDPYYGPYGYRADAHVYAAPAYVTPYYYGYGPYYAPYHGYAPHSYYVAPAFGAGVYYEYRDHDRGRGHWDGGRREWRNRDARTPRTEGNREPRRAEAEVYQGGQLAPGAGRPAAARPPSSNGASAPRTDARRSSEARPRASQPPAQQRLPG